jgi:hypothetical protein
MANKDNLIKLVAQKLGPDNLKQMVDQAAQALGQDPDVTPEVITQMINLFSQVAENPESYESVIQETIQAGVLDEGDFPEQFDPLFIAIFLLALQGLQQRGGQGFARGGLSQAAQQVQSQGRDSDTMLAHISPHEAMFLKRLGGSGTINPQTGLMEFGLFKKFKKAVKSIVKAVAPIALNFIPVVGPYLGAAYGAIQGAKSGGFGGAILGGLGAALGPGGLGKGLTASLGSYANSAISNFGGLSNEVLGSGILGGATSALAGKNPITGALTAGALANYAPGLVDKYGNVLPEGMAQNMAIGAQAAANTGQGLKGIATSAGASGLASLASNLFPGDPVNQASDTVKGAPTVSPEDGMYNSATGKFDLGAATNTGTYGDGQVGNKLDITSNTGGYAANLAPTPTPQATGALAQTANAGAVPSTGVSFGDIAKLGLIGSLIAGKTPQQANDAIMQDPALTAQQKEGMLRSLTNYTFSPNMTTFPAQGTPEYEKLMANLSQGIEQTYTAPTYTVQKAKGGRANRKPQGALSQMSYAVQGPGTGRSDSIEARLSDGEYVIDAETVALLGNGSTKAGAAMLDQMRQGIRQQKGRALAKGKFSPDAKSPLAYMKGGLR